MHCWYVYLCVYLRPHVILNLTHILLTFQGTFVPRVAPRLHKMSVPWGMCYFITIYIYISVLCFICSSNYTSAYCPAGSATPTLCPAGTYGRSTGRTLLSQCLLCPVGTFGGAAGATDVSQCLVCAPGLYAPTVALSVCQNCGAGSFSNTTGMFDIYLLFW